MCFSPTVSFSASAGLAVIGVLALRKTTHRHEFFLAAIPLLFASQQCIEGLIWLGLLRHGGNPYGLTQSYAVFVGIIWPIMVPLSLWMIEADKKRKRMMAGIIITGVGIAAYTLNELLRFPITARIVDYCIIYEYPIKQPHSLLAFYVIATCAAFFFSSEAAIAGLGVVYLLAFLVSYYFYSYDLTSVWCFFAAIISGLIYLYFDQRAHNTVKPQLAA